MSFSERVLNELESGSWTLQSIAPSFRRRLAATSKMNPFSKSITEYCMSFYGETSVDQISCPFECQPIDPRNLSKKATFLIENVIAEYGGSRIICFETAVEENLREALKLIENSNINLASLTKEILSGFIRIENVNFRSASHPHVFGLILIGDGVKQQNSSQMAVSIVHELAHQELFLVNLLDRLVNQPFDYHEVHAPFQGVKRPPIGRLHSLWALYRMVQFQNEIGEVNQKYKSLLKQNLEAFEEQELTNFAKKLVEIAGRQAS